MSIDLTDPIFNDEAAAYRHFETIRWPHGPVCPHCGVIGDATKLQGKTVRAGLYKCRACKKQFTATIGTVYERSHIALCKWLLATHLLCASKKGMSAHQLWRMLGFGSYRTAWFMAHRIREAMKPDDSHKATGGFGGENKPVEVDETYVGGKAKNRAHRDTEPKKAVLSLVERGGRVKSFHIANVTAETVRPLIVTNVNRASVLMSDESTIYPKIGKEFSNHQYSRELLFHSQTRNHWRLSFDQRSSLASLPCRVRFPLQQPFGPRRRGYRARGPRGKGRRRQAVNLSSAWSSRERLSSKPAHSYAGAGFAMWTSDVRATRVSRLGLLLPVNSWVDPIRVDRAASYRGSKPTGCGPQCNHERLRANDYPAQHPRQSHTNHFMVWRLTHAV